MKPWIVRLWLGAVIMTGLVLAGFFLYDIRAAAHPPDSPPKPETGVFGLKEINVTRWEGRDRPTRLMRTFRADATAYTASEDETDSTPCRTANGTEICNWATEKTVDAIVGMENADHLCAVNGLSFGTRAWSMETGFCVMLDRMNARYKSLSRVDMLMRTKDEAFTFGVKRNIRFTIID